MRRTCLLPTAAVLALALAGCSSDDAPLPDLATEADGGTLDSTMEPPVGDTVPPGDDVYGRGDGTDDETGTGDGSPAPGDDTTTDGAVPTPDEETPVVLAFDGRAVPLATACAGVDGAILATTEGEVTITLVQEEGTSLRYEAEGTTTETDEVTVDDSQDDTVYSATFSSDEVEELAVTMTVVSDAAEHLPDCE